MDDSITNKAPAATNTSITDKAPGGGRRELKQRGQIRVRG